MFLPPSLPFIRVTGMETNCCCCCCFSGGVITDIQALADAAHEYKVPLIIDNTLATPYLCRPIEHGADLVVHSTTKFLSGHGNAMGGCVVDSGTSVPALTLFRSRGSNLICIYYFCYYYWQSIDSSGVRLTSSRPCPSLNQPTTGLYLPKHLDTSHSPCSPML